MWAMTGVGWGEGLVTSLLIGRVWEDTGTDRDTYSDVDRLELQLQVIG